MTMYEIMQIAIRIAPLAFVWMSVGVCFYVYAGRQGDSPVLWKMVLGWPLALLGFNWPYK